MRRPMSGRLVRPIGIAPARRIRSTTGASEGATALANAGTPQVVAHPATSILSLMVNGTPCRGPSASPAAALRSASIASRRASSPRTFTTALTAGLTASIRRRCASITSTQEKSFRAIPPANAQAERLQSSVMSRASHVGLVEGLAEFDGRLTQLRGCRQFGWGGSRSVARAYSLNGVTNHPPASTGAFGPRGRLSRERSPRLRAKMSA